MTAEWLHLPPPYPPGVGPLCGAELEAWYEDLQDILGSDAGGAKLARAPTCTEVSSLKSEMAVTSMMSGFFPPYQLHLIFRGSLNFIHIFCDIKLTQTVYFQIFCQVLTCPLLCL